MLLENGRPGCELIHANHDGLVDDLTVMLRPLRAVHLLRVKWTV
jgi:hypothetical protein